MEEPERVIVSVLEEVVRNEVDMEVAVVMVMREVREQVLSAVVDMREDICGTLGVKYRFLCGNEGTR